MVMVTITVAGVAYAWVRDLGQGVWAPAVMHDAFDIFMERAQTLAVASSAATLAYVTTETGVVTLILAVAIAGYLLIRTWPAPARPSRQIDGAPQTEIAAAFVR